MQHEHGPRRPHDSDDGLPVLLIVALLAMVPVIGGIIAVSSSDAVWALLVAVTALVLGTIVVATVVARQLSDSDDDLAPATIPVRDAPR
jgi:hypothetical protein